MSKYRQCDCCGKYYKPSSDDDKMFCSDKCKEKYARCIICGNYYEITDEEIDKGKYICSDECKNKYRYKQKKDESKLDFSDL